MSTLKRRIGLVQATAINMIDMVGIGPFVVIPLVVSHFHSGMFIWAWLFGALAAFIDGMIWSELGAKYPLAGGTYNFHRIAYGEKGGAINELFVCVANKHPGTPGCCFGGYWLCPIPFLFGGS
jgi:amino acid transporter